MMWFKRCPKCEGDLFEGDDLHGSFISCIQCGNYLTEAEQIALKYASIKSPVEKTGDRELVGAAGRR